MFPRLQNGNGNASSDDDDDDGRDLASACASILSFRHTFGLDWTEHGRSITAQQWWARVVEQWTSQGRAMDVLSMCDVLASTVAQCSGCTSNSSKCLSALKVTPHFVHNIVLSGEDVELKVLRMRDMGALPWQVDPDGTMLAAAARAAGDVLSGRLVCGPQVTVLSTDFLEFVQGPHGGGMDVWSRVLLHQDVHLTARVSYRSCLLLERCSLALSMARRKRPWSEIAQVLGPVVPVLVERGPSDGRTPPAWLSDFTLGFTSLRASL